MIKSPVITSLHRWKRGKKYLLATPLNQFFDSTPLAQFNNDWLLAFLSSCNRTDALTKIKVPRDLLFKFNLFRRKDSQDKRNYWLLPQVERFSSGVDSSYHGWSRTLIKKISSKILPARFSMNSSSGKWVKALLPKSCLQSLPGQIGYSISWRNDADMLIIKRLLHVVNSGLGELGVVRATCESKDFITISDEMAEFSVSGLLEEVTQICQENLTPPTPRKGTVKHEMKNANPQFAGDIQKIIAEILLKLPANLNLEAIHGLISLKAYLHNEGQKR